MQKKESIFTKLFKWLKRNDSINEDTIVKETPIAAQRESTRCPQCGNAVELLLPCMGFGDPVVYKCPHCQYTITHPGTSIITESGKLLPYWSEKENIVNPENGEIKLSKKINYYMVEASIEKLYQKICCSSIECIATFLQNLQRIEFPKSKMTLYIYSNTNIYILISSGNQSSVLKFILDPEPHPVMIDCIEREHLDEIVLNRHNYKDLRFYKYFTINKKIRLSLIQGNLEGLKWILEHFIDYNGH